jgi:hypothetical protein
MQLACAIMSGTRHFKALNSKELKRFTRKLKDLNTETYADQTEEQLEYLVIERMKMNIKFVFLIHSERTIMGITYSHLRKEINFLELIINRYSTIYRYSHLIQMDLSLSYNEIISKYATERLNLNHAAILEPIMF